MKAADAISEILKREGVEWVIGYPVNHILERAAAADIRPIIVRQERTGLHMAEAISRVTSGKKLGVFAMQHGPGTENAYGGVAQAYSESVPDPGDAHGLCAARGLGRAALFRQRQHGQRHQVGGAGDLGQGDTHNLPSRLHPAALGPRRPGAGGSAGRRVRRGDRHNRLCAGPGACARAPTRRPCVRRQPC